VARYLKKEPGPAIEETQILKGAPAMTRRFTAKFATGDAEFFSETKTPFTHAWRVFNGKAGQYWQGMGVTRHHAEMRAEKTAAAMTDRADCKLEVVELKS
jgi:hypothetical protein